MPLARVVRGRRKGSSGNERPETDRLQLGQAWVIPQLGSLARRRVRQAGSSAICDPRAQRTQLRATAGVIDGGEFLPLGDIRSAISTPVFEFQLYSSAGTR